MSALLGGMFFVGSMAPAYAEIVNKYNKTVVVTYSVLIGRYHSAKTRTFLLKPNGTQRTDLGGNGTFRRALVAEWNPKATVGIGLVKVPAMSKLGRGAPGKTLGTALWYGDPKLPRDDGLNWKFTIGSGGQVKTKLLNPRRR